VLVAQDGDQTPVHDREVHVVEGHPIKRGHSNTTSLRKALLSNDAAPR
jgi:hypothetical protein